MKPMSTANDAAADLRLRAMAFSDQELDEIPLATTSVYGQSVRIIDRNGKWPPYLRFEHIGSGEKRIPWGQKICNNPYLEWLFRLWVVDRIETTAEVRSVLELADIFAAVDTKSESAEAIALDLLDHFSDIMPQLVSGQKEASVTGVRSFYSWATEADIAGFDEQSEEMLRAISPSRFSWVSPIVALRDPNVGPYTAAEMSVLNQAVRENPRVSIRQRAMFLLARDWGLRPVQISLLRIEDLGGNELGPYVMVPSVKGVKRSKLRRAKSNMVCRHIADDTAAAVRLQVEAAPKQCAELMQKIQRLMEDGESKSLPPVPMFPARDRQDQRLKRYCDSPAIFSYAMHTDATTISTEFRRLTSVLAIPMSRMDARDAQPRRLMVGAYRLRRTKGTSLVLAGHLADEVAEALDHSNTESVGHYFKYSRDVHRFINDTAARSSEIVAAAQSWEGRLSGNGEAPSTGATAVGSLGLCVRESACPYHPTVSCYACRSFRPDIGANHSAALESIKQHKALLEQSATGALKDQLQIEVAGAMALIQMLSAQSVGSE